MTNLTWPENDLQPLTIFTKSFILAVWQDFEFASETFYLDLENTLQNQ